MPVVVRWHPFRLDPTIPPEGIPREEYFAKKFGSSTAMDAAHQRLEQFGAAEGITYRFDLIQRSPNTTDAHRLVAWAQSEGQGDAMVERLFAAYFSEGLDVGDRAVLADLAASVGLDRDTAAARLAGDADRDQVIAEMEQAPQIGITGVPCFILAGRYAVMGAQAAETLAQAIQDVAAKEAAAT
jgi:predicted DsbA family dithiol-disulfide isomerase